MPENTNDSSNQEDQTSQKGLEDQTSSKGGPEDMSREELVEKNKQLYARAKKAEEQLDNSEQASKTNDSGEEKSDSNSADAPNIQEEMSKAERRVEQRLELKQQGYTDEQLAKLENYAEANGMTLKEAKDDPFVKGGLQEVRQKQEVEEATPASSTSSQQASSEKSFSEMSESERKEHTKKVIEQQKKS